MQLSTNVGVIEFRLADDAPRNVPEFRGRPFTLLDDGTEVQVLTEGSARYLLVDHRRDPERPPRVEFWECVAAPEVELAGLWAVCDAMSASN